ncbi:MAG: hypothetical protein RLZ97_1906 [Verrucomicrobiota bacterium]
MKFQVIDENGVELGTTETFELPAAGDLIWASGQERRVICRRFTGDTEGGELRAESANGQAVQGVEVIVGAEGTE